MWDRTPSESYYSLQRNRSYSFNNWFAIFLCLLPANSYTVTQRNLSILLDLKKITDGLEDKNFCCICLSLNINFINYAGANSEKQITEAKLLPREWNAPIFFPGRRLNTSSLLCDCQLKWLPVWVAEQTFMSCINASCAHPQMLKGRSMFAVSQEEFVCGEWCIQSVKRI